MMAAKGSKWKRFLSFWKVVMGLYFPLLVVAFMGIGLSQLIDGAGDVFFLLLVGLVSLESLAVFVWALTRSQGTWRSFRIWLTFQCLIMFGVWCLLLCGGGLFASPPPPGRPRCGTGFVLLLMAIPVFGLMYAAGTSLFFGALKFTIQQWKPHFYTVEGVWTGETSVDCGPGSLALVGEGEDLVEGALSMPGPEGMLSFD